MNPRLVCLRATFLLLLLVGASGCSGDDVDRTELAFGEASAMDALRAVFGGQEVYRPYSSILDAGPNVAYVADAAEGSPMFDDGEDRTVADLLVVGQISDVVGLYGTRTSFDAKTEASSVERVDFNSAGSSPVIGLVVTVESEIARSDEARGRIANSITVELGLPRFGDGMLNLDATRSEFRDMGRVLVYIDVDNFDGSRYSVSEGGALLAQVADDDMVTFPFLLESSEGLVPDNLRLDQVVEAAAESRALVALDPSA